MRLYSIIILAFLFLNCVGGVENRTIEPNITYTEVQRIVGDTLFIGVSDIEVSDNGNIIVSEVMRGVVTELSPNGNFIRRIGNQGDGPSEFRQPWMIELINDSLFLYDNLNSRLNIYGKSGEFVSSVSNAHNFSNDLYKIDEGYLNINFDPFSGYDISIYSVFDENYNKLNVNSITFKDVLGQYYKPIHNTMLFSHGVHSAQTSEITFLIASPLHTGKIYEYTLALPGGLTLSDSLSGLPVDNLYYESNKLPDINAFNPESRSSVNVRLKSLSLGLFVQEDGKVVHFLLKDDEEVREIGVELFDADKNFLGYKAIKTDSTLYDADRLLWSFIHAFDGKDKYYTNSINADGETEILVFRLEINE